MNLQLGSLWARSLVEYQGRLCTYSLAVFGPGSLLCTRVDCELTAWQSLGQVVCYCRRVDCELTAWQSLGQVACCVRG